MGRVLKCNKLCKCCMDLLKNVIDVFSLDILGFTGTSVVV